MRNFFLPANASKSVDTNVNHLEALLPSKIYKIKNHKKTTGINSYAAGKINKFQNCKKYLY